nr:hypothetical protein [Tanacetum cinerariifolium]
KLTNLTFEERFAFNASLRMFTRSIVIQRRVEDLQLGVESYQKKLNLTKPDTIMQESVDLKFFLEEVYKATTDQLDLNNPERQQYPHNLLKLLPLIPNSQGRYVIPFDHFINNDLEYLRGGASSRNTPRTQYSAAGQFGGVTGTADDQPVAEAFQHPNKALPAAQGDAQSWISDLARQADARSSFNELLNTPIDFSNFIMHRLNLDTLTPDLLAGPTYELMRGSCTSLTELEYHLEEVYKATTDQLDWVNPEGQQYPHNLLQPLQLILDNRGRWVISFEHFINNDLEYLRGGASSHKYTMSVTKTKVADYGHIKWIEDLVPREMWIQQPIDYNKH